MEFRSDWSKMETALKARGEYLSIESCRKIAKVFYTLGREHSEEEITTLHTRLFSLTSKDKIEDTDDYI